jgi:PAS domain S-box-containing protein
MLTAVEAIDESVVITNPAGIIEYVNPAFEEITGYTRQEVLGQNTRILKSGQHPAEFYTELWATISGGEVWRGRMINRKKDGTLYEEKATISPVLDEEGRICHYVAVKFDLTREIKLQNELHHAQKMEALGQMAAGITHDFNNILQIILGHVHFVQDELDPSSQQFADVEQIRRAAESAAELTSRLMAFGYSQINSFEPLQLNTVVKESLALLRRVLRENTRVEFRSGAETAEILADPNQLQQLILNLALNAQDAMPRGGRIEVSTGTIAAPAREQESDSSEKPAQLACLRVKDEGIGMDRVTQEQIFDPFFTTKSLGGGTGLGLATVYGIVQQHGGTIQVRSALGEGTEFEILIPIREEELHGAHTRGG